MSAELEALKAVGERAYDRMYEARDRPELDWRAEVATDAYRDAIRIAEELGLVEEVVALRARLQHIKEVARQLR